MAVNGRMLRQHDGSMHLTRTVYSVVTAARIENIYTRDKPWKVEALTWILYGYIAKLHLNHVWLLAPRGSLSTSYVPSAPYSNPQSQYILVMQYIAKSSRKESKFIHCFPAT